MTDSTHSGALADAKYMARALVLAQRGRCSVTPNPAVGCVLVRDGQIIGEGWHQAAGQAHAEVAALQAAGDARGATAYVTLEPCNHTGRTGPCSEALISAGVTRVVAAMMDPNPQVAGTGLERLRAAGIAVESGLLQFDAEQLNRGFCQRMRTGRPFVTIKLAASLDGFTAAVDGSSQWITGEAARSDVQKLRSRACAIVTGVGTVLADNPQLSVRLPGEWRQPLRVVLDSLWRTPADARVVSDGGSTLLIGSESSPPPALSAAGCETAMVPGDGKRLDLNAVLTLLGERGCNEVLVEAGAELAGSFIEAGLCDELWLYSSADMLGAGRALAQLPSVTSLAQRKRWRIADQRRIGSDLRTTLLPAVLDH